MRRIGLLIAGLAVGLDVHVAVAQRQGGVLVAATSAWAQGTAQINGTAAAPGTSIVVPVPAARLAPRTEASHPFGAADMMQQPVPLSEAGYVEEEFFVSGTGNVYDWNADGTVSVRHSALPYTTRIVVRRPTDPMRFSGTVLIDMGNRGTGFDTFGVWNHLSNHLLSRGHAYVGVTVFASNIGTLRMFDRTRYAELSYPKPVESCAAARRDTWNRPAEFFPPAEDGIRWDVMSQVAALVKSDAAARPLAGYRVERAYASMQSAGDLPTYVNAFSRNLRLANGRPVYDAFLIKDSGGPRIPLNDCTRPVPDGDPRRIIRNAGVPVMQILSQNAVSASIRRPDSDAAGDQFRLYEVPGASHFDRWQYSYPTVADLAAAGVPPLSDFWIFPSECRPHHVAMNSFPLPYIFAGAFANLDAWVRQGTAPPRATFIELNGQSVVADEFGNARGGVRTPWVDVPTSTFHQAMEGRSSTPFRCADNGYWTPLPWPRLEKAYGSSAVYSERFRAAVARRVAERWVTPEDGDRIKESSPW